jgi:hypothetical protein
VLPNAAPVLGPVSAPAAPVPLGQSIAASAAFTDADVPESQPYTATINWGDGSPVTTRSYATPGMISAPHTYGAPGLYSITISVRQDNLPTHSDTERFDYVIVYDANGTSVTGGGWIDAPTGSGTDRGTFGFVVRYEKGAPVPTGNLEFQAHDGEINLKATSFAWLIVNGSSARFAGTGTVNGVGDYGFDATVVPGDPGSGSFSIRIWDRATGATLYDSQAAGSAAAVATRITGGSIRIRPPTTRFQGF